MDGLELERLVADDYLEGLLTMPMADVRAKKAECSLAESALSYLRRLVGVRLDIVRTELERRADGGTGELSEIIEHLPEILAEGGTRTTTGRLVSLDLPDVNHRVLTADLDKIFDVGRAALLAEMDEAEVRQLAERLEALERRVSTDRRAIHGRLDVIQAEVIRRYKTGEASPDSLLE
jgi:hypothetical protein